MSEVTWSKAQGTSLVIGRTQAYALRQLDALADKLERKTDVDDLAKAAKEAESSVQEWLAVLAHCFRLQDAIAVLELDRVLDSTPDDLEQHRLGLRIARQNRLELLSRSTERLIARMGAAAARANAKVLLNPINSPAVVRASNHVASRIVDFHGLLGIERDEQSVEARRWLSAAGDLRDKMIETGAEGVGAGRRLGTGGLNRARSMTNRLASGIAERTAQRRDDAEDPQEG